MKNEGGLDRIIRVVLAIIFFIAGWSTAGVISVVLYLLAFVMLFTAVTGFCLLYKLFGINTNSAKK